MNDIKNLAAALVKAQAAMGGAKKDSNNPFFKSKYADLKSVDAAISGPAADNGLAYVQVSHNLPDHAAIETVIIHSSGETMSCGIVAVPVSKDDAQGFGSAMTYARRYSLSAAFGVCPEDDDGNAAAKAPPKSKVTPTNTGWEPDEAEREHLNKELGVIRDLLNADQAKDAADYFYREGGFDQEEMLWVQNQLSTTEKGILDYRRIVNALEKGDDRSAWQYYDKHNKDARKVIFDALTDDQKARLKAQKEQK
jgi:hypothetical protein